MTKGLTRGMRHRVLDRAETQQREEPHRMSKRPSGSAESRAWEGPGWAQALQKGREDSQVQQLYFAGGSGAQRREVMCHHRSVGLNHFSLPLFLWFRTEELYLA